MRGVALGAVVWILSGCGAASHAVVPRESPRPPDTRPVREAASEILIDGVRDGALLEEREGLRLVGGSGTVALVGADGHVRAAHRFGYGGEGTLARFLDDTEVVVADVDAEGFRGPYSGRLVRWHLDDDTLDVLGEMGDGRLWTERFGRYLLISDSVEYVYAVDGERAQQLVDAVDFVRMPDGSFVTTTYGDPFPAAVAHLTLASDGSLVETAFADRYDVLLDTGLARTPDGQRLVRLVDRTVLDVDLSGCTELWVTVAHIGCFPDGLEQEASRWLRLADLTWIPREEIVEEPLPDEEEVIPPSVVASIGARGIPEMAWSSANTLALGASSGTLLLDARGLRSLGSRSGRLRWGGSPEYVVVGMRVFPLDGPSSERTSTRTEMRPYLGDIDEEPLAELQAYDRWADGGEPPTFAPLCNDAAHRCVRTVANEERRIVAWGLFDPRRPSRELRRIEAELPVTAATAFMGAAWLRVVDDGGAMHLEPLTAGEPTSAAERWRWVELESGWVVAPGDTPSVVTFVPDGSGEPVSRSFEGVVETITIADEDHVLVEIGFEGPFVPLSHHVEVLELPSLTTVRQYAGSGSVHTRRCRGADLIESVTIADETVEQLHEAGCPIPHHDDEDRSMPLAFSGDGAFWVEPLGDVMRIHRTSDGAVLEVRMTTEGALVVGPGPSFEASGTIAEHLVVRSAGPVRAASLTVGPDVRARFERPGLVAAFFAGQPLP